MDQRSKKFGQLTKEKNKLISKKFPIFRKYFKAQPKSQKSFIKEINYYYDIYKDFWDWRKNFKYPDLNYLKRVKTVKPEPSDILIKNLAKGICELKKNYLNLADHREVIIFKLFLFYISQCLMVKAKYRFYTFGWGRASPVENDLSTIRTHIIGRFLKIKHSKNEPQAKDYGCFCGKYLRIKQKKGFLCEKCKQLYKQPIRPWNEEPQSFAGSNIDALNHYTEPEEYKKYEKELRKLLKKKNKKAILTVKHPISRSIYQTTPNEMIAEIFFRLNFHNDKNEVQKIFLGQDQKIIKNNSNKNRIMLFKDKKNIEYYWGDLQDGKPHGKGVSEKYETDEMIKKTFKKVGDFWWKKYSKNLNAKDLKSYIINEKYEGEWKNGKPHGKGELIIFDDPAYVSNKDWTPSVQEKYIGIFQNGGMHGEIKKYDNLFKEWTLINYKNGVAGKSVKIKKKQP